MNIRCTCTAHYYPDNFLRRVDHILEILLASAMIGACKPTNNGWSSPLKVTSSGHIGFCIHHSWFSKQVVPQFYSVSLYFATIISLSAFLSIKEIKLYLDQAWESDEKVNIMKKLYRIFLYVPYHIFFFIEAFLFVCLSLFTRIDINSLCSLMALGKDGCGFESHNFALIKQ